MRNSGWSMKDNADFYMFKKRFKKAVADGYLGDGLWLGDYCEYKGKTVRIIASDYYTQPTWEDMQPATIDGGIIGDYPLCVVTNEDDNSIELKADNFVEKILEGYESTKKWSWARMTDLVKIEKENEDGR